MAAFASEILKKNGRLGKYRFHRGSGVASGGSTGGDVDTGLRLCFGFWAFPTTSAGTVSVNEAALLTGPIDGSAVTCVCSANCSFMWYAYGFR